jgi:hypothetical protein
MQKCKQNILVQTYNPSKRTFDLESRQFHKLGYKSVITSFIVQN